MREHALRGEVDVGRELVGVPAEQQVARVGVDGAEHAVLRGDFHFVLHRVAGQRGVVGLDVQLEVRRADRSSRRKFRQAAASESYWCLVGSFGFGSM